MLVGAIAQSLPDIDFIHALWMDPASNLLAHRGFTHSLLFGILITVLLSALAGRFYRKGGMQWRHWVLLIGVEIAVHLLLDVCNQYGMGLLEPFSHQRFSVNAIFVADPFFSLVPFMATLVLLVKKKSRRQRVYWWGLGLIVPALYLLYCFVNKYRIDAATREDLAAQQISFDQYFTTPTPFNNWLWYTVAGDSTGFYVAHRSALYPKEKLQLFSSGESFEKTIVKSQSEGRTGEGHPYRSDRCTHRQACRKVFIRLDAPAPHPHF